MRIFRSLEEVPADFGPTIVSVGNFDGIHCGHLSVLKEVTERARQSNSKAVAVTFEPHPFRILRPDMTPRLITPLATKEALLAQTGLEALLEIPYGETTSYGAIARRVGQPNSARAVGVANGANPIALVIPCHRVIGSDGSLTGYGGGLPLKRALLEHEARVVGRPLDLFA